MSLKNGMVWYGSEDHNLKNILVMVTMMIMSLKDGMVWYHSDDHNDKEYLGHDDYDAHVSQGCLPSLAARVGK